MAVDPDGKRDAPAGGFLLIAGEQPCLRLAGDRGAQLFVVVPSTAVPGKEIPVRITARDAQGNTATDFEGEGCGRPNYWRNNYQNSVRSALARGYRLGIVASGDSHDGRSGNSDWMRVRKGYRNGLVAVYAPELTREAVFDGLWDRRCYGTSGPRILLDFALNQARMGQELDTDSDRSCRRIQVDVAGTAPLREIAVVRNGRAAYIRREKEEQAAFEWIDQEEFAEISLEGYDGRPFVYYYIRILQEDGEMVWSSPIWVTKSR